MCTLVFQTIIPFEWVYGSMFRACEGQDPAFALEMWQGTWMSVLGVKSRNCQLHRSYIKRRAQMHCVDMSARYSYMYKSHMSLQLMLVQFLEDSTLNVIGMNFQFLPMLALVQVFE